MDVSVAAITDGNGSSLVLPMRFVVSFKVFTTEHPSVRRIPSIESRPQDNFFDNNSVEFLSKVSIEDSDGVFLEIPYLIISKASIEK